MQTNTTKKPPITIGKWAAYRTRRAIPVVKEEPHTAVLAKQHYEAMCSDGTAGHSAQRWMTCAYTLGVAATIVGRDTERGKALLDRAADCVHRSRRAS